MPTGISYEEFDTTLKKRLNLRFEPLLLHSIMKAFDDTGDGQIDYRKFCELVMGSTQQSETSLTIGQIPGRSNHVSADSGNSDMMVRRKIRMSFKALRASFRDLVDNKGGITQKDLSWVLSRYDIDLTASQYSTMLKALGCENQSDKVTWEKFQQFFKDAEAEEDENDQLRVVKGMSVEQACKLIREKLEGILQGGPDELRRAFRVFDTDMSGSISYEEFDHTMKKRLNLRFEPALLSGVMKAFDDTGDGEIDYRKFCELVMGSTKNTASSLAIGQIAGRGNFVSADGGNSDMMIRRKIRVSFKQIRAEFRDVSDAQGAITPDDLAAILARYDIDMAEEQFVSLLQGAGCRSPSDRVKWTAFVEYFRHQEEDEDPDDVRNQLRIIKGIKVGDAVQIIQEKIEGVMEGGPDGLRRAFRIFDANMNGSISYDEFDAVLKQRLNLRFEPALLSGVMKAFDDTGDGEIDYRKFCELVMGSTKTTASSLAMGQIAGRGNFVSADGGNSDMMVRRKVRSEYRTHAPPSASTPRVHLCFVCLFLG
jgi:Ca2+-binding EF-hand superfamily protein